MYIRNNVHTNPCNYYSRNCVIRTFRVIVAIVAIRPLQMLRVIQSLLALTCSATCLHGFLLYQIYLFTLENVNSTWMRNLSNHIICEENLITRDIVSYERERRYVSTKYRVQ